MLSVTSDGIPGRGCVFTVLIKKDLSPDLPFFSSHSIANSQHQVDDDLEANHESSSQAEDLVPDGLHAAFAWNSKPNRIQPLKSPKSTSSSSPRESDYAHSLSRVQLSDADHGSRPSTATAATSGAPCGGNFFPQIALCVDDSALNRKLIGKYLEQHFEVLYAVDGLNAVQIVKNSMEEGNEVDIVFMDNLMPVMDGLEATRHIRELGFKGPIVGITGNCEPEQIEEFVEQGATTVIPKPIQLEHFGKVILGKSRRPLLRLFPHPLAADVMGNHSPESLVVP
jgi:CheY-like chemotaxis protein